MQHSCSQFTYLGLHCSLWQHLMHGEIIPEDLSHSVYWLPVPPPSTFPLSFLLPMQAIYVLLQKRFIFNSPDCKSPSLPLTIYFVLALSLSLSSSPGKWKNYPVTVTAYSYFFGALFMGLSTIYFAATGQGDQFAIPQNVSMYACMYVCLYVFPPKGGYQGALVSFPSFLRMYVYSIIHTHIPVFTQMHIQTLTHTHDTVCTHPHHTRTPHIIHIYTHALHTLHTHSHTHIHSPCMRSCMLSSSRLLLATSSLPGPTCTSPPP